MRKLFLCLSSQTKFCSLKQWRTSKNKKSFQVDDKVLKRQITKFYLYDHIVDIYFWSHFSYNDTYLDGIISTSYHFLHTLHSSTKNIYKEIFFFQTCLIPGKYEGKCKEKNKSKEKVKIKLKSIKYFYIQLQSRFTYLTLTCKG